jgi:hypothetical protein
VLKRTSLSETTTNIQSASPSAGRSAWRRARTKMSIVDTGAHHKCAGRGSGEGERQVEKRFEHRLYTKRLIALSYAGTR